MIQSIINLKQDIKTVTEAFNLFKKYPKLKIELTQIGVDHYQEDIIPFGEVKITNDELIDTLEDICDLQSGPCGLSESEGMVLNDIARLVILDFEDTETKAIELQSFVLSNMVIELRKDLEKFIEEVNK